MEIAVLDYLTGSITIYVNIPTDWQTEDICNYLYNELGLNEDATAFMVAEDITIDYKKRRARKSTEEYNVIIREELQKVVTIKAKSAKEARELVTEMYNNEEIILSADDFYDHSIETL